MRNLVIRILVAAAGAAAIVTPAGAQVSYFKKPAGASGSPAASQPAGEFVENSRGAPAADGPRIAVSPNSPLVPGAEVSFQIIEENEPPVRAIIADTGELEIPGGLGRVAVSGMTPARAEEVVKNYLEGRYYKRGKATVRIGLNILPASGLKRSKVIMSGKLLRSGAVDFYPTDPKTVSEAVNEAGTTIYSDTKRVQVTRGTEKFEINVKDILENGNTRGDMKLRDGDRIFVPERGIVFGK
jgi:protein involved in polysaccharide export with SLBB domain